MTGRPDLLADPQLRETGDGIDWYAARSGDVRRFADLDEAGRAQALQNVERHLAAIRSLGAQLKDSSASEEARLIGRSLELATARRRTTSLHGGRRTGDRRLGLRGRCRREPEAFPAPPVPLPQRPAPAVLASAPAAILPARVAWVAVAERAAVRPDVLLLLMITSWLMRACAPVDPTVNLATLETPAPPAPSHRPIRHRPEGLARQCAGR